MAQFVYKVYKPVKKKSCSGIQIFIVLNWYKILSLVDCDATDAVTITIISRNHENFSKKVEFLKFIYGIKQLRAENILWLFNEQGL